MSLDARLPPPLLDAAQLARIDEALSRHGLIRQGEPVPVPNSVLNQNFRVPTDQRDVVVRIHAPKRDPERLELEWRAIDFAREHGIPVRPPLVAAGRGFHSIGGRLVSVFPWLDAVVVRRGSISEQQSAAVGDMQGRIHTAFRDYHDHGLRSGGAGSSWDTEQSIADLSRVDDLIRYYPAPGDELLRIQDGLRFKLELLESGAARPRTDFDGLALQPTHGDYHEGNVLLAQDGSILAVIGWEAVGYLPPVFEVLRAVTFSLLLEPPLLDAYLGAYAHHRRLTPDECLLGVELWWQSILHDTWLYTQRFIEGSRAVDHFFPANAAHTRRFADPAFRDRLTTELLTHAG